MAIVLFEAVGFKTVMERLAIAATSLEITSALSHSLRFLRGDEGINCVPNFKTGNMLLCLKTHF